MFFAVRIQTPPSDVQSPFGPITNYSEVIDGFFRMKRSKPSMKSYPKLDRSRVFP
jgi:hypothetical protein